MAVKYFFPKLRLQLLPASSPESSTLPSLAGIYRGFFNPAQVHLSACPTDYSTYFSSKILSILHSCSDLFSLRIAHTALLVHGFAEILPFQTKLLSSYGVLGNTGCARLVFDGITDPDLYSCKAMLKSYLTNDCYLDAIRIYGRWRESLLEQDNIMFSLVLKACIKLQDLRQGKKLHCHITKVGNPDDFLLNVLIDMYAKCSDMKSACNLFDTIAERNVVSWTTIISGLVQHDRAEDGLLLFNKMRWAHIIPNSTTIASALSSSAQLHDLALGRSIHALGIKLGAEDSNVVMNAVVDMYTKCCVVNEAEYVFQRMPHKDIVTWNAMMAGYSQNNLGSEALSLFNKMKSEGYSTDAVTVVNALSASASLGSLHIGGSFHGYTVKNGFLSNIYVSTALVNFYNKCGDVSSSRVVFDEMSDRNTVTWCSMMGGYGMQGDSTTSLDLLHRMLGEDMKPNDVIFTSILSTCSHTGMVKEGKKLFERMCEQFDVVPTMKHYSCMVDMLARAGQVEEALAFIEGMPVEAEISVWQILLHGCRVHSRLDVGEKALRRMAEMQPDTPDYYVLLSNLYASDQRWDDALEIRELMKQKRLMKLPGSSCIHIEGR
ncbi:Pentatricopeptide repeat-containing protein [Platanthera zijinensis]|uniref:Pentatricopeptide repeat-containing protein n=1 Tax=Platanthera zijinensis TaxID=2320716 RepID=A0AAP0FVS0_9ASPA